MPCGFDASRGYGDLRQWSSTTPSRPASVAVVHVLTTMGAWLSPDVGCPPTIGATNCWRWAPRCSASARTTRSASTRSPSVPGVSRALMYHYFPDKRTFFAAVVRAEGERLFEATNTPPDRDRACSTRCARACWRTCATTRSIRTARGPPISAWAAPIRCCAASRTSTTTGRPTASSAASPTRSAATMDSKVERDLRVTDLRLAGVHVRDVPAAPDRPVDRRRIRRRRLCACPARRDRAGARHSR